MVRDGGVGLLLEKAVKGVLDGLPDELAQVLPYGLLVNGYD